MAGTTGMTTTGRRAASLGVAALALAMLTAQAAIGATGNLPGGTAIEVTIDDPDEDIVIVVDDEDDLVDVTVSGTAAVGGAAVVKNTTLIYIIDLSGSMNLEDVDCGFSANDSRLDCQAEAIASLNALAAAPASPVGAVGFGSYAASGTVYNLDLDDARTEDRRLVAPDYDGNGNGIPDVVEVVRNRGAGGLTNFAAGLEQALILLEDESRTTPVNRIVYISDGQANRGANASTFEGRFNDFGNTRIDTFAITNGSGCGSISEPNSLRTIAALGTTGGTCTEVEDLGDLSFVLGGVLASELTSLTGNVDGGESVEITDVTPELPEDGPASVDYTWNVGELGIGEHEICVTATGSDGGGDGSVEECRTVTITVPGTDGLYPPVPEPEVLGEVLYPPAPEVLEEATPATPVAKQPDYTG